MKYEYTAISAIKSDTKAFSHTKMNYFFFTIENKFGEILLSNIKLDIHFNFTKKLLDPSFHPGTFNYDEQNSLVNWNIREIRKEESFNVVISFHEMIENCQNQNSMVRGLTDNKNIMEDKNYWLLILFFSGIMIFLYFFIRVQKDSFQNSRPRKIDIDYDKFH